MSRQKPRKQPATEHRGETSWHQAAPVRTMVYATYMWKAGFIKPEPKSWKDYFFPLIHDREGS